jgi:TOBE domain
MRLINGPQSLADNNLLTPANQTTHFDTACAGQWDNGQGFIGVSNPSYGTLTYGRTTLRPLDRYEVLAVVALGGGGDGARLLSRMTLKSWTDLGLAEGEGVFVQVKQVSLSAGPGESEE